MKKLSTLAFAAVLALSGTAFAKETSTTLKVSGWSCGGCANKTAKAVKKVSGVKEAKSDKATNSITVTYDDALTTVAAIETAITSIEDHEFKIVK
jgi:copper chaperone CopZ